MVKRKKTIEQLYANDPVLLDLYTRKLPKHGWAGAKTAEEREYIRRAKKERA